LVEVVIVVREVGRANPEYSLKFDLPEIPAVGSYISINRPDHRDPLGEDLVVRKVWWRLFHPITAGYARDGEAERAGEVKEIFVECDKALGPYASDDWRTSVEGREVERFEVERRRTW
jgi:hypothetical protein